MISSISCDRPEFSPKFAIEFHDAVQKNGIEPCVDGCAGDYHLNEKTPLFFD